MANTSIKIPTVTKAEYAEAQEANSKAALKARAQTNVDGAKVAVAGYEKSVQDARDIVGALRAVAVAHAGNKHLSALESTISRIVSSGEEVKSYYLTDAKQTLKNYEATLAGKVEDNDEI